MDNYTDAQLQTFSMIPNIKMRELLTLRKNLDLCQVNKSNWKGIC
jgi:hypothetical protein